MFRFISKFWESFKEYIILSVLLITSLIILSLNQKPAVKKVRSAAFGSFAAITTIVSDVIDISKIKSENNRLRRVNAELMIQVNKLREYGVINENLRKLIDLKDSLDYPLVPASVVSKALTKAQETITINVGSREKIRPGMPVINDQGLVGIVYSTSEDFAIIRTLKNFDLKLTVKDERSRIDGIMKWNGEELVIIDVPKTYDVEPGDRIITSDLSSIISIPIPVGIVAGITNIETGIFNQVRVKPFIDFASIEYVFVVGIVPSKQKNDLELNFYNRE
ncbi:MAG: rod shape-determining protein MreC [Ignavibacteria bacterium]